MVMDGAIDRGGIRTGVLMELLPFAYERERWVFAFALYLTRYGKFRN